MDEETGTESLKNLTSYRARQWGDDLNRNEVHLKATLGTRARH